MSAVAAAIAGGLISSAGQLYANKQNIDANEKRFGEQTELANSAHQREVLDLQKAGLNPILSASGSGAAVPQLGSSTVGSVTDQLGEGVSTAGRLAALDIPLKESQVGLNSAHAESLTIGNKDAWHKLANDSVDDWARFEAMTDSRVKEVENFVSGKEGWKAYNNLVKMYRNQIETGRYQSALPRAVLNDVLSGANSAAGVYGTVRGGKTTKTIIHRKGK